MDFHKGEDHGPIQVCSSLWEPQATDLAIFFRDFEHMPTWEQKAMSSCKGRTLDIGAGAGAHSLHLQTFGCEILSLELSKSACQVMRERSVANVVHGDIFRFRDRKHFDTLLLLMNGAGIARSLSKLPKLLKKCKSLLKDGGQILIDSTDIMYMYQEEDGNVWLNLNSAYYGEVDMWMEYNGRRSKKTQWLYVDPSMLEQTAQEVGLKMEVLFQDTGGQYLAKLF